jgi:hypothetical protein
MFMNFSRYVLGIRSRGKYILFAREKKVSREQISSFFDEGEEI